MDATGKTIMAAKRNSWRADHRARAHESAHADPNLTEQTTIPAGLQAVPRGAAAIISDDAQLARLVQELRSDGTFTYDSEFIGELSYFPRLCLIQVASHARIALIDPLANLDLQPFWELLADAAVQKIVHAGEQDLEPVNRHIGKSAANVIDTQIAAGFIGLPYPLSLSKLVGEMTGARLGKGLTFSHWDQRPLSAIQLRYAADDVRYLPAVWNAMRARLESMGHLDYAKEESEALCSSSVYRFDPQTQFLRIRGASSLAPRNLAVLRELTIWRDATSRHHDVPPRTFLRDEVLLELARNPVKSIDKLARVRGLPRPVEKDFGSAIVEMSSSAMALPATELPESPREAELSPPDKFQSDALFAATQSYCAGLGIDPALVTSRADFGEFYRFISGGMKGPAPRLMQGWRKKSVGDPVVALFVGQSRIDLSWKDGGLRAHHEPHRS